MKISEKKFLKIIDTLDHRPMRAFFDGFSDQYRTYGNIDYKIERLAALHFKGLLDGTIKYYLKKYERYGNYDVKNDIMKKELNRCLKFYISYMRYGNILLFDNEIRDKTHDELDFIIAVFKKEIEEKYEGKMIF